MSSIKNLQLVDSEEIGVPCTVPYHFSLLSEDNNLRYCCHGDRIVEGSQSIIDQWNGENYRKFREDWYAGFYAKSGLCEGCSHHEENKRYQKIIAEYLESHSESNSV